MSKAKLSINKGSLAKEKDNCSKHRRLKEVFAGETAKTLAAKIANLHYEDYPAFFQELAGAIKADGNKDFDAGRHKLGVLLIGLSKALEPTAAISKEIWKVCKPYMNKKKKK